MNRFRFAVGLAFLLSATLMGTPAQAFFHLWRFTEFFSSADGSVQFIELRSTSSGESEAMGAEIRSMSTGNVFTFPADLTGSTLNKNLLITTANFGALPGGVTPDYDDLPANFFNPAGDTIALFQFSTIDTKTFTSVPTDGAMSRNYFPVTGLAINSPRNFSGASGSVDLAVPEPTAAALMLGGLLILALFLKRRS